MKRAAIIYIFLILLLNVNAQEWGWTVGKGGSSNRDGLAGCVLGPLTPDNVLWDNAESSYWPRQVYTYGDVIAVDRCFDIGNTLHGAAIITYDLLTGTELWRVDLPVESPSTDWRNRVCGISKNYVYGTRSGNTNFGYLYALDIETGEIVWRSEDLIDLYGSEDLVFADNGDILAGGFNDIKRISVSDGTTVWETARNSPTSGGSELAVYGSHAYAWEAVSNEGIKLSVYDINSGDNLYQSRVLAYHFFAVQQLPPFVGADGIVYAPRASDAETTDTLFALHDSGTELVVLWQLESAWVPFGSHGVGPDSSVYMYSRDLEVLRVKDLGKNVISRQNIGLKPILNRNKITIDNSDFSLAADEPGFIKIRRIESYRDNPIPIDTSIYIGDTVNYSSHSIRMAIDGEGYVFVSNGRNNIYCFDHELNTIWTDEIVDVGGPALAKDGHLIFQAENNVIKVYEGRGSSCTIHEVVFFVHDQFDIPLMGAIITIGNESLETGENGEAVFNLEEGEISYIVFYQEAEITGDYLVTSEPNQIIDVEFVLTSMIENDNRTENIYPNPTSGIINLTTIANTMSISVTDITGKIIFYTDNTDEKQIDISNFENGIYLIRIQTENRCLTEKIIKN